MKKQITLFSTLVLIGFSAQAQAQTYDENQALGPHQPERLEAVSSQEAQGPVGQNGEILSDGRCGTQIRHQVTMDAPTKERWRTAGVTTETPPPADRNQNSR